MRRVWTAGAVVVEDEQDTELDEGEQACTKSTARRRRSKESCGPYSGGNIHFSRPQFSTHPPNSASLRSNLAGSVSRLGSGDPRTLVPRTPAVPVEHNISREIAALARL